MQSPGSKTPASRLPLLIAAASTCAALAVAVILLVPATRAQVPLPAPGLAAPVDLDGLWDQGFGVTTTILANVYDAFAHTDEGAIYDGLAQVAAGDALEALYLERAGALASGGLPDQVVHELRLTDGNWRRDGDALTADVRWAVLGEVGHAEHTHMRGNAYAAELRIAPMDGAWRLTGFRLTDVDRTDAGTLTTLADEVGG